MENRGMQLSDNSKPEDSKQAFKPSKQLAWCFKKSNIISMIELETHQRYANFQGVQLKNVNVEEYEDDSWTHLKEIPNTGYLVSLHNCDEISANLAIFDVSQKRNSKKIYSFDEIVGVNGYGDVTYNSRRSILGAICIEDQIAYHLFKINTYPSKTDAAAKLCRKSKWRPQYSTSGRNFIPGLDFDPSGDLIATIDRYGVCLISDVNTSNYIFHLKLIPDYDSWDLWGRCRWSINVGEPFIFLKYDWRSFNILDVDKKVLILKSSLQLEEKDDTIWIDACPTDGNLVASCGGDQMIKIIDRREAKVVKTINGIHSDIVNCVRWHSNGSLLASVDRSSKVALSDFTTGKLLHTEVTADGNAALSVCFV